MNNMKQFLRIANARLRRVYPNGTQRKAWVAKMWANFVERKNIEKDI